jgi:predicted AAA+ superfamily ATPase
MNLKRKAYQQLLSWKNRAGHLPLIVEGLRQVGKSYIVDKFARENYENVIVFDFRYNEVTRSFFQGNLTVDEILKRAYPYFPSSNFVPHKTIIVMEEIGDCPRARTSLKAFESDGRFDVIATGSLLGVANYRKRKKEALPTGSEEFLKMTSLDFEEFLWAIGASQDFIDRLKDSAESFAPLPEPYIEYGKVAMRSYLLVGGMPDAVIAFLESGGDPLAAREVHRRLLRDYEADFGRYVDDGGEERYDMILKGRISAVWKT